LPGGRTAFARTQRALCFARSICVGALLARADSRRSGAGLAPRPQALPVPATALVIYIYIGICAYVVQREPTPGRRSGVGLAPRPQALPVPARKSARTPARHVTRRHNYFILFHARGAPGLPLDPASQTCQRLKAMSAWSGRSPRQKKQPRAKAPSDGSTHETDATAPPPAQSNPPPPPTAKLPIWQST
jgi:hypothetical protein